MALTNNQIRERKFTMGTVSQVKKFIQQSFFRLENRLETLLGKVLSVRITNHPEQINYTKQLDFIKKALLDVVEGVRSVENKEVDLSGLDKLDAVREAIESLPEPKDADYGEILVALNGVESAIKGIVIPKTEIDTRDIVDQLKEVVGRIANLKYPDVSIAPPNLDPLTDKLGEIQKSIEKMPSFIPRVDVPKMDLKPVLGALGELREAVGGIPQPKTLEFPDSISINNFPPQKIPQPVTNISINPLRGAIETTAVTVGTTAVELPDDGAQDNRRSVLFYNNDSATTIYIGGSDVTPTIGLPIGPMSSSPAFDSGPTQTWYGVTALGNADVRCVEVANDDIGG